MRRDLLKWNKVPWNKSFIRWQKVNILASSAFCKNETNGVFLFQFWPKSVSLSNHVDKQCDPFVTKAHMFPMFVFQILDFFAKHLLLVNQIFCKWRYLTNCPLTLCNALGTSATNINVWEARMPKCDTFWTFTKVWLSYYESPMAKIWALTFKWLCAL